MKTILALAIVSIGLVRVAHAEGCPDDSAEQDADAKDARARPGGGLRAVPVLGLRWTLGRH